MHQALTQCCYCALLYLVSKFWNCALISVFNELNPVQVSIEEKSMVFLRGKKKKGMWMDLTVSRIVLMESEFIV